MCELVKLPGGLSFADAVRCQDYDLFGGDLNARGRILLMTH